VRPLPVSSARRSIRNACAWSVSKPRRRVGRASPMVPFCAKFKRGFFHDGELLRIAEVIVSKKANRT
jgi:hypothetical protein